MAFTEHGGIKMNGPLILERLSSAPTPDSANRGRIYHDTVIAKIGLQKEDDTWEYVSYFPAAYKVLFTEDDSQFDISSLGVWSYNSGGATFQNENLGSGATEIDYFKYTGGHRVEQAVDTAKALPVWSTGNAHHAVISSHAALRIGTVSGTEWDTIGLRSVVIGENSTVTAENSAVIAGSSNSITATQEDNAILGANAQTINGTSRRSAIVGGTGSTLTNGDSSSIFGGGAHVLSGFANTLLGGAANQLGAGGASQSVLVGGREIDASAAAGDYQATLGGYQNTLSASGQAAVIVGGTGHEISGLGTQSGIFAGRNAQITGLRSAVLAGDNNDITSSSLASDCAVIAGSTNLIGGATASTSAILAGNDNQIVGGSSVAILGGDTCIITGGIASSIVAGSNNALDGTNGGILGGQLNSIASASAQAAVIGGSVNSVLGAGENNVIITGTNNTLNSTDDNNVMLGGSGQNLGLGGSVTNSSIVGGLLNSVSSSQASIIAGDNNTVNSSSDGSVIVGGSGNSISGTNSIVGGVSSVGVNRNFIWSSAGLTSATDDVFGVQASNGLYFSKTATGTVSITAGRTIDTDTGGYLTDAGVWQSTSSVATKQAFEFINPMDVLYKVLSLGVSKWEYKKLPGIKHIGPMAEEFAAIFNVGDDDKALSAIDTVGVALAAIQGLKQYVDEKLSQLRQ